MLNRVLGLLAGAGWFDTATAFEKTINLTQGACLWLLLTRQGSCDTYVKFSECISLELEARRCAAASRCYPALVPRFVGYVRREGLEVLVCRAVDYRALRPSGHAWADLKRYFEAMPTTRLPRELTPTLNAELLNGLEAYFAAHPSETFAAQWLSGEAARRASAMPNVPQHGDLVLNNIGETIDGTAVIFDWEDFGASCLPGLDLFTLELSLAGDAAALLAAREQRADAMQQWVRDACDAMQLDLADYRALTPIYSLVFRHLKRNYGPGVRERVDRLLLTLSQQACF